MYKLCKTEQSAQRQKQLEQGLLKMMKHHHFEEISVSELCDRMGLPRKSFYRYFSSKDGALLALLDHTMMTFYETGNMEGLQNGNHYEELVRFFRFWKEHADLLDALRRSNLSGLLVERAIGIAKQEDLMPGYVKNWEATRQDLAMNFVVCGLLSLVLQWHKEGYRIPVEQMTDVAMTMLTRPLVTDR